MAWFQDYRCGDRTIDTQAWAMAQYRAKWHEFIWVTAQEWRIGAEFWIRNLANQIGPAVHLVRSKNVFCYWAPYGTENLYVLVDYSPWWLILGRLLDLLE